MNRQKVSQAGFTLIEVAMVVLIGGLMMAAAATALTNYLKQSRIATTQSRMQDIDTALVQYLSTNGVLPCAASLTDAPDSATFGRQIANDPAYPGNTDCYTAAGGAAGTFKNAAGRTVAVPPFAAPDGKIVIGAVPVRTLNLPDQDIADAWGSRFLYAVSSSLTVVNGYDPNLGVISVIDSAGADVALNTDGTGGAAQYVIVAPGEDRVGAYSVAGTLGTACPVPATSTLEAYNCSHVNIFRKTLLAGDQIGANQFDDYVTFRTQTTANGVVPSGLIAPFSLAACPAGWAVYAAFDCSASLPNPKKCCKKQ